MLEQKLENRNIKPTTMRLLVLRQLVENGPAISLKVLEAKFERRRQGYFIQDTQISKPTLTEAYLIPHTSGQAPRSVYYN